MQANQTNSQTSADQARPERHRVNEHINVPRYQQVFSALQQWIAQGHYPPLSRLETEKELCEIFGVSRITVRKALELLAAEGLVKSVQGKGTFVQANLNHAPVHADMNQRIQRARELARNSNVIDLTIAKTAATSEVCDDLKLQPGEPVQKVSYVRLLRDMHIGYVESFCPMNIGVEFSPADFHHNTLLTVLEDKGVALSGIDHLVGATLADTELARLLNLDVGMPLVRVKMIMLDLAHKPVQKVVAHFRADQYEHHLFLARQGQED